MIPPEFHELILTALDALAEKHDPDNWMSSPHSALSVNLRERIAQESVALAFRQQFQDLKDRRKALAVGDTIYIVIADVWSMKNRPRKIWVKTTVTRTTVTQLTVEYNGLRFGKEYGHKIGRGSQHFFLPDELTDDYDGATHVRKTAAEWYELQQARAEEARETNAADSRERP